MKREIKFRGLRIDGKGWVFGNLMEYNNEFYITPKKYSSKPVETFKVIPESVGQFTGLTDKNGAEIYEEDILKSKVELEGGTESIIKIVYGEGGFDMEKIEKDGKVDSMYLKKYWKHSLQVIGNIHENPELLLK